MVLPGPDLSALTSCRIVRVTLDQQVGLGLAGHDAHGRARVNATLTIDAPFSLVRPAGDRLVVPGEGIGYAEVAGLFGQTVLHARVDAARTLVLELTGLRLAVAAEVAYDAWELEGLGVPSWVMSPSRPLPAGRCRCARRRAR